MYQRTVHCYESVNDVCMDQGQHNIAVHGDPYQGDPYQNNVRNFLGSQLSSERMATMLVNVSAIRIFIHTQEFVHFLDMLS